MPKSIYQEYQEDNSGLPLTRGIPDFMAHALDAWISKFSGAIGDPYYFSTMIKTKFRFNSVDLGDAKSWANYTRVEPDRDSGILLFAMRALTGESKELFLVIDYWLNNPDVFPLKDEVDPDHLIAELKEVLDAATHEYCVSGFIGNYVITQRLTTEDEKLLNISPTEPNAAFSLYRKGFRELYGVDPDNTTGCQDLFKSVESALKHYLDIDIRDKKTGKDRGGLGELINELCKDNQGWWTYKNPGAGESDAKQHFVGLIKFVNNSLAQDKHGSKKGVRRTSRETAEVVLRVVALVLFKLENSIVHRIESGEPQ